MAPRPRIALVIMCAVIASVASRGEPIEVGAVIVASVVGIVGMVGVLPLLRAANEIAARTVHAKVLSSTWLLISFLPAHRFTYTGITDSNPALSAESMVELLTFLVAGGVAVYVLRRLGLSSWQLRPPIVLFVFPTWLTLTFLWSDTGAYALGRGIELLATALLAWATIEFGRSEATAISEVISHYLRWFVRITAVLVGLGVLFGPRFVLTSYENLERFSWMGAHPILAGVILSIALTILAAAPQEVLRLPTGIRLGMAAAFLLALVHNNSRQSWVGLAVAAGIGVVIATRRRRHLWYSGLPFVGAALLVLLLLRGGELWNYLLRDGDADSLRSGNGRSDLWGIGIRHLATTFDWVFGLGVGTTRTLFLPEAPWANSAHSSFLAALVSAGAIGLALLVVQLVIVLSHLARRWVPDHPAGPAVILVFVLLVLKAPAADSLVEPGLAVSALNLIAATVFVWSEQARAAQRSQTIGATPASPTDSAAVGSW